MILIVIYHVLLIRVKCAAEMTRMLCGLLKNVIIFFYKKIKLFRTLVLHIANIFGTKNSRKFFKKQENKVL
jgi:hypothetical protein